MRAAAITALFIATLTGSAFAQDDEEVADSTLGPSFMAEPYRLVYDHVSTRFTLYDDDGRIVRNWRDVPASTAQALAAPVPPGRPLEIVVINANSLVYNYSLEASAVSTERVRTCGDIGKDFLSQGFFATTRSLLGAKAPLPSLDAVIEEAAAFRARTAPTVSLNADRRARVWAQAKQAATMYQGLSEHVAELSETLADSVEMIALRAETEPIGPLIDGLLKTIERNYPGLSDPRVPPIMVSRVYRNANDLLKEAIQLGSAGDFISVEAEALMNRIHASAKLTGENVKVVQRTLLRLTRARAMSQQSSVVLPSDVGRRVSIRLTAIEDTTAGFNVLPVREGTVIAYTRPSVGMLCQVSAGLSWMKPGANYVVSRTGTITDGVDSDEIRTAPAVFFSIGPSAIPQLAAVVGIGLGEGGRPDLYGGASLRAFSPVLVNAGFVWQREHVLPDGMNVGDSAPTSFTEFEREFKPSFFFGLSFGR